MNLDVALIVDDHPIARLGCAELLRGAGFAEVQEAKTANEAYRMAEARAPALIVLDIGLPGVGGLTMIDPLLRRAPDAQVLVFSMHDQAVFAARALEAGARGYLTKSTGPEEFREAVATLARGEIYLERRMAVELATMSVGGKANPLGALSDREHQVLRLIGSGAGLQEIADSVNVSYKTAANASSALKKKLGARTMSDLIRIAIENDIR